MQMQTEQIPEMGQRAVQEAERVWRNNPVPVVLGALAAGLVIGVLVRSASEPRTYADELRDRAHDAEDYLHDLVGMLAKRGRKGYKKSAAAMKDTLEKAVEAARDVDMDDYVDPANKWFRGLWKKCCS